LIYSRRSSLGKKYEVESLPEDLNAILESPVHVERIKVETWQTIDMLISEEALLFAKYLRNERIVCATRLAAI
jgi:hypothetical protein